MRIIKQIVKQMLTFFRHPIFVVYVWICGSRRLVIGKRVKIGKMKYLKLGNSVSIGNDARFLFITNYYGECYKPKTIIGSNVSIGNRFSALSAALINIGDNALIASDVLIASENHGMNPELSYNYAKIPLIAKPVSIGEGCWIGEKVTIMPGVNLGERCIVAANAVVTKSFPSYCMLAGIPAKIIKKYNFDTHCWERVEL